MKHNEKKKITAEEKLQKGQMINKKIVLDATLQSLVKLNPKVQIKNPVMFVVYPVSYTHLGNVRIFYGFIQFLLGIRRKTISDIFTDTPRKQNTVLRNDGNKMSIGRSGDVYKRQVAGVAKTKISPHLSAAGKTAGSAPTMGKG